MAADKGVAGAFRRLWKTAEPAVLPQRIKGFAAPREQLMHIALVADIENDSILRDGKNSVQRHRELDNAEV